SRIALLKKGLLLAVGAPYDLIKKYGGVKIVIFKIKGGVLEKDLAVVSALVNQPSLVQKGELLFIPFKDEKIIGRITAVTEHLLNKGYDIMLSTTKEPDLEDVFLNLIGEGVGD
ncbi:MAG: hypothetical protein NTY48_03565, partial [Candidatus Diapherotrites archaeon]|nr:hypothetical protein [Candidatus Diapherotrites archaeon]